MPDTAQPNDHAPHAPDEAVALMRMVDFRIPLPWLLSGFFAAAAVLISMWFQLQEVSENLTDLQVTVKAGNSQSSALAGDVAMLKFRVENLEEARRNGAAAAAQQNTAPPR